MRLQVLPNHALFGDYTEAYLFDILDLDYPYIDLEMVSQRMVRFSIVGEAIFIQSEGIAKPGAEIIQTDLLGCGGPVHIIDRVLLPAIIDGTVFDLGTSTVQ